MRFLIGMRMAIVMISTTMKPASLMEEIAVDLMWIHIGAQNVCVLKEEGDPRIQQHQGDGKNTEVLDAYYS